MFRFFTNTLGPMRPASFRTSIQGIRFAFSFTGKSQASHLIHRRIDFSWCYTRLNQPRHCHHCGRCGNRPNITNIFILPFGFASFLLSQYLELTPKEVLGDTTRVDQPAGAETVDSPSILPPILPDGYVHIDYAVNSLIQSIDPPIQASPLCCQQLILIDLSVELMIIKYGGTYLRCKELVDAMDWGQWWRHWASRFILRWSWV